MCHTHNEQRMLQGTHMVWGNKHLLYRIGNNTTMTQFLNQVCVTDTSEKLGRKGF